MTEFVLDHDAMLRLGVFVTILVGLAAWETAAPRRVLALDRRLRWPSNIGIAALNALVLRAIPALAALEAARDAAAAGIGLLNAVAMLDCVRCIAAIVLLDLAIYLQHVLFHAVPGLWRLHRMHHADLDFDVTTGARFHPFEILISAALKLAFVVAIGAPPLAVLLFEIILSATSLFNHSNIRIGVRTDGLLRLALVTPDMHRVHHSAARRETNSNFGFSLPWWDRLFGTYRAQPAAGHEAMTIGIEAFRAARDLRIDRMLVQPFRGPALTYPIGRGEGP